MLHSLLDNRLYNCIAIILFSNKCNGPFILNIFHIISLQYVCILSIITQ